MSDFHITPSDIREGFQITLTWEGDKNPEHVEVTPDPGIGVGGFKVPFKKINGKPRAQWVLDLAGRYELGVLGQKKPINVGPRRDLGFTIEFGITVLLISIFLFAVIYLNKKKNHGNE